jgi:hypothetical protein
VCKGSHKMFRTIVVAILGFVVSGCSEIAQSLSEPELRVLDGDDQVHAAAAVDSLDAPVRAQLYQTVGGGITMRLVTPLYAQENVVGVRGEQVCAVPVGDLGLEPWNPCAITDTAGIARFWFEPGTKAGQSCAEIRAVVGTARMVTDSVCATVEPGRASTGRFFLKCEGWSVQLDTLDLRLFANGPPSGLTDEFGNVLDWRLVPFSQSSLYTVAADGKRLVAVQNVAGLDSVRVQDASRGVDATRAYVRVRQSTDPKVVIEYFQPCGA